MTTATYSMRRNQNLARTRTELRLGPVSATVVMILTITLLALLYLNQITKSSVFGYQLSALQQQQKQAIQAKQALEIEAARLTSIQNIQNSQAVKNLVPASQVTYAK